MIYIVDYSDLPCSLVGPFDNVKKARDWALASHGSSPGWGLIELDNPSPPCGILPHTVTRGHCGIPPACQDAQGPCGKCRNRGNVYPQKEVGADGADAIERDRDLRPSVQRFGVESTLRGRS